MKRLRAALKCATAAQCAGRLGLEHRARKRKDFDIDRRFFQKQKEELLRGAAAAGLSAEDQANLAAGSDSLAVQQQAQDNSADAVVAGAAGAAAFLAHSTRAVLRSAARRDGAS